MLCELLLDDDDTDLGNVVLSHYRLSTKHQQILKLKQDEASYLVPRNEAGSENLVETIIKRS
jgi:type I restriction enzyme, R subunit